MQKNHWFSTLLENIFNKNRTMKISIVLFAFALFNLHANSTYSQLKKVTIKVENESIKNVLGLIESQSKFKFFYKTTEIDLKRKISLQVKDTSIKDVLKIIFDDGTVTCTTVKNQIVIKKDLKDYQSSLDSGQKSVKIIKELQQSVSGKIIDGSGMPIPGVSVVVKGTSNGVAADFDGNYSITVDGPESVLVFSYIGLASQEVAVGNRQIIDVTMQDDALALDDVVVIGYGTQKRSNLTGAISSIKSEDLDKLSVTRVDQALQGKAAGVMVSQPSGKPGSAPSIHVRGVGSIGGTSPLWIVDGIRMGTDNFFNVNDIESIEVLKDASASAIYGAQAAHGVVLVTTKRGMNNNKINVDFKATVGVSSPINLPSMLDRDQFIQVATASRLAAGQQPDPSWSQSGLPNTDWSDELFSGSGLEQNYNLAISSGTDKANYYISGAYSGEEGIMVDNKFERYNLRANSDFKLFDGKVKIGESMLVSRTVENPTYAASGIPWRSIPMMPVYDETNPYGGWGTGPAYYQGRNPVGNEVQHHAKYNNNRFNGNVYLEIDLLKDLKFRSTFGINYSSWLGQSFNEAYSYGSNTNTQNSLVYASNDQETLTANYILTYDKTIGDHSFKAMAGYEAVKGSGIGFNATMVDFPVDLSYSFNLATGAADVTDRNTIDESRILSQFGRFNYSYKDKYMLEGSVRRDASAPKFGKDNLWGVFPSFSAGWRISQEDFLKDHSVISNLKLRLSSGTLGSDNIGNYLYSKSYYSLRSFYAFNEDGTNKVPGFFLNRFPNEAVKWEEITMSNVGIDLGLFNNKLSVVMDYYVKKTTDMLYAVPVPLSTGISYSKASPSAVSMNVGEMKNTGFEMAVNYQETFNELKFNIAANASFMKNELTSLIDNAYINGGDGGEVLGSTTRSEEGMPLSSFYGYEFVKIIDSQSELDALNTAAPDGVYQSNNTAPGDMLFRDLNGDNEITADDKTYIGNPWPKMIYGLTTNLEWRDFDFSMFLQGIQGVDVFNGNKTLTQQIYADYNTSTEALNAWTPTNQTGQPRIIQSDPNGNFRNTSSYFVEDGSFLKVRNIQLGYELPESFLSRLKMSRARVYISADNILTLTKYSGIDPEVSGGNTGRGVDYNSYPQTKTISMGISLGL